jgi:hypothetical protein
MARGFLKSLSHPLLYYGEADDVTDCVTSPAIHRLVFVNLLKGQYRKFDCRPFSATKSPDLRLTLKMPIIV